jgi:anti-sigma factor RsiW
VDTKGDLRHLTSEEIQDLLDQAVPPREDARIQEHLSSCVRCRTEVEAWSELFGEFASLGELAPGPAFSQAVLESLPVREPLGARIRGWLAARVRGGAPSGHVSPEGIQDYLDHLLPTPRRARVEAHLAACAACRGEVKSWAAVFESLGDVGQMAPSPNFAREVMARVRIPTPSPVPVPRTVSAPEPVPVGPLARRIAGMLPTVLGQAWALARRTLPQTRRGWAVAGGMASAPTITLVALLYLVFSRPLLTAGAFLSYASWKVSAFAASVASLLTDRVLASASVYRLLELLETLAVSPLLLGAGGLVFSLLCGASVWVLHRNLFAAPSNEGYAHVRL